MAKCQGQCDLRPTVCRMNSVVPNPSTCLRPSDFLCEMILILEGSHHSRVPRCKIAGEVTVQCRARECARDDPSFTIAVQLAGNYFLALVRTFVEQVQILIQTIRARKTQLNNGAPSASFPTVVVTMAGQCNQIISHNLEANQREQGMIDDGV